MLAIAKTWSITYYSTKGGFICLFVCFDFIFIFFSSARRSEVNFYFSQNEYNSLMQTGQGICRHNT